MSTFARVVTSIISSAAFIACLWWAYSALKKLDVARRLNLPASVRMLAILAVGVLAFLAVNQVLNGLFAIFAGYEGWYKAAEIVGALAMLGFIGWLYTRVILEQ
jgi:hypothetical protein